MNKKYHYHPHVKSLFLFSVFSFLLLISFIIYQFFIKCGKYGKKRMWKIGSGRKERESEK